MTQRLSACHLHGSVCMFRIKRELTHCQLVDGDWIKTPAFIVSTEGGKRDEPHSIALNEIYI